MSRIAYVNGVYAPHRDAGVHIEDRGYQFGDGVYEVWSVFDGRLADADGHFARLDRSLRELQIAPPMGRAALTVVLREVLRKNRVRDGLIYLQVTRGVARRDHAFPSPATASSLVITARAWDHAANNMRATTKGIGVITLPENRWGRCDIKSINLLPNVLAKEAAKVAGAGEAWFVDAEGLVTEGAASNAWIVDARGALRTRATTANILRGVTRSTLMQVIADNGLTVEERPFTVSEAKSAREAFITGAGALVMPVVSIDGQPIGDGRPGGIATALRMDYVRRATKESV
jgi:D-alanine transaminase